MARNPSTEFFYQSAQRYQNPFSAAAAFVLNGFDSGVKLTLNVLEEQSLLGPVDGEGQESFDIVVCTPKWLMEKYGASDVPLGLHEVIVFKYDYLRLRQFVEKYLMQCSGSTWGEVAQKVSLLGQWEFEGYQRNS